jgi:hypothetical protein
MMRTVGIVVAIGLMVATAATHAQRELPVEERRTFVMFSTKPPASIDELLASATVVVEATIARPYPHDAPASRGFGPQPYTAFALESVDMIKPAVWPGDTPVAFMLRTTDRNAGDRVLRFVVDSEPAPRVGERWVLFLRPSERGTDSDPLVLAIHDRESAFLIRNDAVVPAGKSELSKTLAGMGRAEFVSQLRGK